MKLSIILFSLVFSGFVFSAEVDGKITYKLPSGDLVSRDVTIDVP